MLAALRRKLCAITMALVGCVLVLALGLSLWSSWASQNSLIQQSLQRSLEGQLNSVPMIGATPSSTSDPGEEAMGGGMLALALEISSDGYVLQTSDSPVIINASVLDDVISRVVDGDVQGSDHESHVAWKSETTDEDSIRIAIVDTRASDASFERLCVRYLLIGAATLVVLFVITWCLSAWSLRPVEEAWSQQRRFVADASHELKTPLSVIIANTEILQKAGSVDEENARWLDSTADEAAHMRALIEDLLQLARADESASGDAASALKWEKVNLSELVEQAALEFDAVAFEQGVSLDTSIEAGIEVEGDSTWLDRIVRILIDNACKYGAAGSTVQVCLTTTQKALALGEVKDRRHRGRHASSGKSALLSVTDQGTLIDAADLPHVFDRFWRSDKARTRGDGAGGFGLGLAIAKATVEAHHGSISVTSTAEEGTTFSVSLPSSL